MADYQVYYPYLIAQSEATTVERQVTFHAGSGNTWSTVWVGKAGGTFSTTASTATALTTGPAYLLTPLVADVNTSGVVVWIAQSTTDTVFIHGRVGRAGYGDAGLSAMVANHKAETGSLADVLNRLHSVAMGPFALTIATTSWAYKDPADASVTLKTLTESSDGVTITRTPS